MDKTFVSSMKPHQQRFCVIHQPNRPVSWGGEDDVVKAFLNRDTTALACALHAHPNSWQTELGKLDRKDDVKESATVAHFAILIGWDEALPVLHKGGDPLNYPDLTTGYTPLGTAICKNKSRAFEWLLQKNLGEGIDARSPLEALIVGSKEHNEAPSLKIAQDLIQAGYNPWGSNAKGEEFPYLCVQRGYIQLASFLANQSHAQGLLFEDPLIKTWLAHLHAENPAHHVELLNALKVQNRHPSMATLATQYKALCDIETAPAVKHFARVGALEELLIKRVEMGVEPHDARLAADTLRLATQYLPSYMDRILAQLDHAALDQHTIPQARVKSRPRI